MKAKKVENGYFLRIDKGEEIVSTITDFIARENIRSGAVAGIGALTKVELGYFDRNGKEYLKKTFNNVYELLSLTGNVAYIDNKPILHAHCMLGDADYNVTGGHLFKGTVAVTGEIFIRTFTERFDRRLNDEFSLNLLSF